METININIAMAEFEASLDQLITQSQLPVGVVSYILKQYSTNTEKQYIAYVNQYYLSHNSQNISIDPENEDHTLTELEKQGQE